MQGAGGKSDGRAACERPRLRLDTQNVKGESKVLVAGCVAHAVDTHNDWQRRVHSTVDGVACNERVVVEGDLALVRPHRHLKINDINVDT